VHNGVGAGHGERLLDVGLAPDVQTLIIP
jgi:hypothetical protein